MMAPVGHRSMQRVQLPQWLLTGASIGSGRSVKISPRKKYEPASFESVRVCLPRQPRPAFCASGFSMIGAESQKTR